jgi:hypothetical protein
MKVFVVGNLLQMLQLLVTLVLCCSALHRVTTVVYNVREDETFLLHVNC